MFLYIYYHSGQRGLNWKKYHCCYFHEISIQIWKSGIKLGVETVNLIPHDMTDCLHTASDILLTTSTECKVSNSNSLMFPLWRKDKTYLMTSLHVELHIFIFYLSLSLDLILSLFHFTPQLAHATLSPNWKNKKKNQGWNRLQNICLWMKMTPVPLWITSQFTRHIKCRSDTV